MIKYKKSLRVKLLNAASTTLADGSEMILISDTNAEVFEIGDEVEVNGEKPEDKKHVTKDGGYIETKNGIITAIEEKDGDASRFEARMPGFVRNQIAQSSAREAAIKAKIFTMRTQNLKKLSKVKR